MPIKAVFSDMDGTLLNPQHQISAFTASILRGLKEKGIYFIVSTGRPYADVFLTIKKCGLKPDFIITSDGARIHDGDFNLVREHNMRPELAAQIARLRSLPDEKTGKPAKNFITNIYQDAKWVTDKCLPQAKAAFNDDFHCVDLGEKLYELSADELKGVHEAWFLGKSEDLAPLMAYMKTTYSTELCCTYSMPYIINCVPYGVSKGNAVREVAEVLKIGLDEVACFGDALNDESMMQIAGTAYIMANGQQELKDVVKHGEVIGSNADDGVAKKLEELFFKNQV